MFVDYQLSLLIWQVFTASNFFNPFTTKYWYIDRRKFLLTLFIV